MNQTCGSHRLTRTEHFKQCSREQGHSGPCSFADGNGMHVWLDGYEWANLRELLTAVSEGGSPLAAANNGDWVNQILFKLKGIYLPNNPPNKTAEELKREANERMATK